MISYKMKARINMYKGGTLVPFTKGYTFLLIAHIILLFHYFSLLLFKLSLSLLLFLLFFVYNIQRHPRSPQDKLLCQLDAQTMCQRPRQSSTRAVQARRPIKDAIQSVQRPSKTSLSWHV